MSGLMRFLLLTSIALLPIASIGQVATIDTTVLRIDPEIAMGSTTRRVYKEVNYIPLQNSEQCIVGEISKLVVVDNYFIVFDRGLDQILIFNKDGSFHAKCTAIPGLHKNATMVNNFNFNVFGDFAVNLMNREIVVKTRLDHENLFVFNYQGEFKKKIPLMVNNNIKRFWGFAYLDSNRCVYTGRPVALQNNKGSKAYLLCISDNFSSNLKEEIPFNPQDIVKERYVKTTLDGPFYQSGTSGECFFTRSYDYNLYLINVKGISRVYKMLLPLYYTLPSDFLTDKNKYNNVDYLNNNRQLVYSISDIYRLNDCLFFKLNNGQYDNEKIFLYQLNTGDLLNLQKVSADEFSCFLPVINGNNSIQACDGKYIYSSFSSLELFDANEANKDKHPQYPPLLKKYFLTQTRKSNPVIVQVKLQENR